MAGNAIVHEEDVFYATEATECLIQGAETMSKNEVLIEAIRTRCHVHDDVFAVCIICLSCRVERI